MHKKILKKYYFIDKFNKRNLDKQYKNTTIIYRNYKKNFDLNEILYLKNYCKKRSLKFLISNNLKLSIKLNLDGGYIPSFNSSTKHLNYKFKKNFILLGSAHNLKEIRLKETQKIDLIFLSSIFKKNRNFLGINKFKLVSGLSKKPIVALGGILEKNEKLLGLTSAIGIAGISYFENKKKGP